MTTPTSSTGSGHGDSAMYRAALEYVRRGWRVVPLHWVTPGGACSCGRPECKAQGKHPVSSSWQRGHGAAAAFWNHPNGPRRENIGILTGKASGFWVLDFDPADAGDIGGAGWELHDRLTGEHGLHPHVRTGGGGYHWRFAMPADGREVRNRQTAGGGAGRTHSLPRGWDVRGDGGQVVAPPSVSAKGEYVELGGHGDWWFPHETPAWLLDMVAAPEREAPPDRTVSPVHGLPGAPTPGGTRGSADGVVTTAEGSSHPAVRIQAYAIGALQAECAEYSQLTDGRRGEAAAAFARSLVEIANLAGWPTVEGGEVYTWFSNSMTTAAGNNGGGGYAPHEIGGQWARAVEHVGGRARVMPAAIEVLPAPPNQVYGGQFGHADFHIVEPGAPSGGPGSTNGYAPSGGGTGQPAPTGSTPAHDGPPPAPPVGMDPLVWEQVQRKLRSRAADRWIAAQEVAERPPLETELITGDGLDAVADPVPVVDGWLFADSLARLNGRPGQGKSFVAIDLACAVATGMPWHGRAVAQGTVLMIVAEGVAGVRKRVRAWEARHGRKVGDALLILPRAVQVAEPEWERLVGLAAVRRPALVVVDTQARVTAGLNENLSADMGLFVQGLEDLRGATGACVLTVHHKGKGDGEGGRGSNAVEGAMVSEFDVWKRVHAVTVKNTKQKDIEGGYQLEFSLTAEGESAVLVEKLVIEEPTGPEAWKAQAIALYEVLRTMGGAAGITEATARSAAAELAVFSEGNRPKYAQQLVRYAWNNLIFRGLVIRHIDTKGFGVHVMGRTGIDGVLTPNVGEWAVQDPPGWQTYAPSAVDESADWSVNLGKSGGSRISEAVKKMGT